MSSRPEQLRKWAEAREAINEKKGDHRLDSQLLRDAADEIERLRHRVAELELFATLGANGEA